MPPRTGPAGNQRRTYTTKAPFFKPWKQDANGVTLEGVDPETDLPYGEWIYYPVDMSHAAVVEDTNEFGEQVQPRQVTEMKGLVPRATAVHQFPGCEHLLPDNWHEWAHAGTQAQSPAHQALKDGIPFRQWLAERKAEVAARSKREPAKVA